jgi:hypothetical protein
MVCNQWQHRRCTACMHARIDRERERERERERANRGQRHSSHTHCKVLARHWCRGPFRLHVPSRTIRTLCFLCSIVEWSPWPSYGYCSTRCTSPSISTVCCKRITRARCVLDRVSNNQCPKLNSVSALHKPFARMPFQCLSVATRPSVLGWLPRLGVTRTNQSPFWLAVVVVEAPR